MKQLYVVMAEDCTEGSAVLDILPLDQATRKAKYLAGIRGHRMNIFKLIQTHTYAPGECLMCGEHPIQGGEI